MQYKYFHADNFEIRSIQPDIIQDKSLDCDRQTVREVTGWKHDTLPAMAIWNDVKGSH